jgi:hypothetical protein
MGHGPVCRQADETDLYSCESNKKNADSQIFFKELTKKICESAVLFFIYANLFDLPVGRQVCFNPWPNFGQSKGYLGVN